MSTNWIALILGSIFSALAAAVISTQTLGAVADFVWPFNDADEKTSAHDSVSFRRVGDRNDTIFVSVPTSWQAGTASQPEFNGRHLYAGAGVAAGTSTELKNYTYARLYAGVSRVAALNLLPTSPKSSDILNWARHDIRIDDWTLDNCTFVAEREYDRDGWTGIFREWKGCGGLPHQHHFDAFVAPNTGEALVEMQLNLPDDELYSHAEQMLKSVQVDLAKLPIQSRATGDQALP